MKLTYSEVMERLSDGRAVDYRDVRASALRRKVWVYGYGQPGCLFDSGPYYTDTKARAIACLLESLADDDSRGAATALRHTHVFHNSYGVATISCDTLGSIL